MEESSGGAIGWLVPLAGLAAGDIVLDILLHSWPEEVASDAGVGLVDAQVSRDGRIVVIVEELQSEFFILSDAEAKGVLSFQIEAAIL